MRSVLKANLVVMGIFPAFLLGSTSLEKIEKAYREKKLTREEYITLRVMAVVEPGNLPSEYRGEKPTEEPCGTKYLTEAFREMGYSILTRPVLSGPEDTIFTLHFMVHYTTQGSDSTDPSYASLVAAFAEFSWAYEVGYLGWDAPPPDYGYGGDDRYDIYIMSLESGVWGYTVPEKPGPDPYQEEATSYIVISNDLSHDQARITVAHELNHACQLSYSYNEDSWWMENCAVWMEDVVYDDVNRYVEFFSSYPNPLSNPDRSISCEEQLYEYAGGIWPAFLAEFYDLDVPRKAWEKQGIHHGNHTLSDLDFILSEHYSSSLDEALREYGIWRYFTGPRHDPYHFSESYLWPPSFVLRSHHDYPDSGTGDPEPPDSRGGTNFIELYPQGGALMLTFNGAEGCGWSVTLIGYRTGEPPREFPMNLHAGNAGCDSFPFSDFQYLLLVPTVTCWVDSGPDLLYSYFVDSIMQGEPDISIYPDTVVIDVFYRSGRSWNIFSGTFNVKNWGSADLVYLKNFLFSAGPCPPSFWSSDVNGDGWVDYHDLIYLASYLYESGPEPVCQRGR